MLFLFQLQLNDNIECRSKTGKENQKRIMYSIPILIGGYAMQSEKIPKIDGKIIKEMKD